MRHSTAKSLLYASECSTRGGRIVDAAAVATLLVSEKSLRDSCRSFCHLNARGLHGTRLSGSAGSDAAQLPSTTASASGSTSTSCSSRNKSKMPSCVAMLHSRGTTSPPSSCSTRHVALCHTPSAPRSGPMDPRTIDSSTWISCLHARCAS
ncbi:hypothetical protein DQ04_15171000 [Trypanosoma grayi]|uniref:hypothetical protein n=1 Tax=Trypanosoma grayi TaxID=71804 RepID=UPI0004F49CF6|nr:hypothetical protein DQ04_15171000 [Trypanosoma grayi]KEG06219.1 hypothetical protein DQ04_15171000 [Trypanosoma grayi]